MKGFFLCFLLQVFLPSPDTLPGYKRHEKSGITVADTSLGILILVNKKHILPPGYRPYDLVPLDERYNRSVMNLLRHEAATAFSLMCRKAEEDSIFLWNISAYRSDTVQRQLYDNAVERRGVYRADRVSARPGHSEHQTGLTADFNSTHGSFSRTPQAAWLRQHAHLFGFIERYPRHKENITGYDHEPWHFRYVGVEAATTIYTNKLTLEEYHGTIQKPTRNPAR